MAETPTGDEYVDAILWGGWKWDSQELTYYFSDAYAAWTVEEKTAFRKALQAWAEVAELTFTRVWDETEANIIAHTASDAQMRALFEDASRNELEGWFEGPEHAADRGLVDGRLYVEGWFNNQQYGAYTYNDRPKFDTDGLAIGGYGFHTYLREIGHALGLSATREPGGGAPDFPIGPYDEGIPYYDDGVYTVMSGYRGTPFESPDRGYPIGHDYNAGPAAIDVAAIQYLYGPNMATGSGDDVYILTEGMGWQAIWDTGGTDKIKVEGDVGAAINLRAAELAEGVDPVPFLITLDTFSSGGYTIAADFNGVLDDRGGMTGVIIEDAVGGGGDDRIYGNAVANVIKGLGGEDLLYGDAGRDRVLGGSGKDWVRGEAGDDIVRGGSHRDRVFGGDGDDRVFGGDGNDVVMGEAGDDRVFGGTGDDLASGGIGDDRVYGDDGDDALSGDDGNDLLVGGAGDDTLEAAAGDDSLKGGAGRDLLTGGDGADRFVFRAGYDREIIRDFLPGDDRLVLEEAIWGGGLTAAQVIDRYASDRGDRVVFDFGDGDRIVLRGVDGPQDLLAAIDFV